DWRTSERSSSVHAAGCSRASDGAADMPRGAKRLRGALDHAAAEAGNHPCRRRPTAGGWRSWARRRLTLRQCGGGRGRRPAPILSRAPQAIKAFEACIARRPGFVARIQVKEALVYVAPFLPPYADV